MISRSHAPAEPRGFAARLRARVTVLVQRAEARLVRWFPQREFFMRSEGHVRFLRISTRLQASIAAGLACAVLVWVGVLGWALVGQVFAGSNARSLLNREAEDEILPFCRENRIGVINYSPMASGLLTGAMTRERIANLPPDDFRRKARQFQEPLLTRNLALADLLGKIGARHNVSAGVIAIAWTLANPAITAAIVGGRNPQQVEGVWPAAKLSLYPNEMQEIKQFMETAP